VRMRPLGELSTAASPSTSSECRARTPCGVLRTYGPLASGRTAPPAAATTTRAVGANRRRNEDATTARRDDDTTKTRRDDDPKEGPEAGKHLVPAAVRDDRADRPSGAPFLSATPCLPCPSLPLPHASSFIHP
jgi:hypothetical protein